MRAQGVTERNASTRHVRWSQQRATPVAGYSASLKGGIGKHVEAVEAHVETCQRTATRPRDAHIMEVRLDEVPADSFALGCQFLFARDVCSLEIPPRAPLA